MDNNNINISCQSPTLKFLFDLKRLFLGTNSDIRKTLHHKSPKRRFSYSTSTSFNKSELAHLIIIISCVDLKKPIFLIKVPIDVHMREIKNRCHDKKRRICHFAPQFIHMEKELLCCSYSKTRTFSIVHLPQYNFCQSRFSEISLL